MADTPRREFRPDPKPEPRRIDPSAGREKLRAEGRCRLCPSTYLVARHHVVPRSSGGDDVDENLVPLCEECHGALHRGDAAPIRRAIRRRLSLVELDYVERKKGAAWLDRLYPT